MRVLLLGPYPPPHGGVQTNLVAIRRFLLERGIPCDVVNLTRFRRVARDGVFYPESAAGVLKLLLRLDYDIVHMHVGGHFSLRLLMLGLVCCLMPGRKAMLTFHSGGYPASEAGRTAHPRTLRGFVFRRFDRVIGVNREIVEMFRNGFGVPEERVRLILPHAAGPIAATLPPAMADFFRKHSPVLLTIGMFEPEYEMAMQVDALEVVRRQFPGAGLAVVGAGGRLEADIREKIAGKPYRPHILLCGDIPHEVALRAISECDLFWRPTLYDGDSISVREALHLGTPVIATDNGMRPDGVHLIPVSDLGALCQTTERLLRNPEQRPSPADAGEENVAAVYEVYRELSDSAKLRRRSEPSGARRQPTSSFPE